MTVSPRSFERIATALSGGSLKRFLDHEGDTHRKCDTCDTPLRQLTFLLMSIPLLYSTAPCPQCHVVTESDGTPGCLVFHPPEFQAKKSLPCLYTTWLSYYSRARQTKTADFIRVMEPCLQVAVVMKMRSQLQVHKRFENSMPIENVFPYLNDF